MSFAELFKLLKPLLTPYEKEMAVVTNRDDRYQLDTRHKMKNGKHLFFASVVINKSYVSFHLMPLYVFPELKQELSPELAKRMQGKSCFNFKTLEPAQLKELESLVAKGYEAYRQAGYVT